MQIQPNQFICADNMEVLRDLPDGFCDLCLTDPPYGIHDKITNRGSLKQNAGNKFAILYDKHQWDKERIEKNCFKQIRRVSKHQIVWGGNYYTDCLDVSRCWLIWDKLCEGFTSVNPELAWTSFDFCTAIFKRGHGLDKGFMCPDSGMHPTQKPVPLFVWCLLRYTQPGDLIIDPFCGSGTTALACHKTGRRFICIDREQKYIDIAQQRYANLIAQQDLFRQDEDARAGQGECPGIQESLCL